MKKLSAVVFMAILLVASAIPVFATNQTDDENITPEEIVIDDESVSSLATEDPVETLATGDPITSLSDITGPGNYYLTADTTELANALTIDPGEIVTLDFNGHTVTIDVTGRPFNNSGTLTLKNSQSTGGVNDTFFIAGDNDSFGAVLNNNGGTLIIDGGNYKANNNGSCVRNLAGGTVTINGGTFTNIRGLSNDGTATINGGTFNQVDTSTVHAYKIWNSGTLTINDATVNGQFGGVAHVDGDLTIKNGTFVSANNYALYIANNETGMSGELTATINGGTYTGNSAVALWVDISGGTQANNPVVFTGGVFTGSTGAANFIVPSGDPGPISPQLSGGTYTNSNLRDYVVTGYRQNLDDRSPEWTVVPDVYDVTVINGDIISSGSSFAPGEEVHVSAEWPERGYVFDKWTSAPAVALDDASSTFTSFIMPANDVTLTANYKNVGISAYEVLNDFNDFKGSGTSSAKVKTNGDILLDLYLGNKNLSPEEDYYVGEDGDTITLTETFLKTLAPGTYEIQAQYQLGYANLKLTVLKSDSNGDNGGNGDNGNGNGSSNNNNSGKNKTPSTGDHTNMSLYGLLLVLSLICIGVTYKKRKVS